MFDFAGVILACNTMKPALFFSFLVKLLAFVVATIVIIGLFSTVGTVKAASNIFPLPPPMSDDQAHITDGIIIWGCMIVAIIFIGVVFGNRGIRKRQPNKPKRK